MFSQVASEDSRAPTEEEDYIPLASPEMIERDEIQQQLFQLYTPIYA